LISDVLAEAWAVYRRLWIRSVVVAGLIFAVVSLAQAFAAESTAVWPLVVVLVLTLLGGLLVQGALVLVVADLHEGRSPTPVNAYYDRTRDKLGTLLLTSLAQSLGAILIVPIARWSLAIPLVMIERLKLRDALRRSSQLIRGQTGRVLVLLILAGGIGFLASLVVTTLFGFIPGFAGLWVAELLGSAVAAPYGAHVLTVLYYRLTDPERSVLPPPGVPHETWRSIWDEEPPA
jgi:glycerophosphoryl diester phosphodiesterase family protein